MSPISGFQALVNGWIKVNAKTSSSRNEADESGDVKVQRRSSTRSEGDPFGQASTNSHASRESDRSGIRRFNNRRQTRKLERTVSLTDLLREMAAEKEAEQKLLKATPKTSSTALSSDLKRATSSELSSNHVASIPPQEKSSVGLMRGLDDQDSSISFVAGFFGGEIPILPQSAQHITQDSKNSASLNPHALSGTAGQYLILHPSQKLQLSPRQTHRRTGSNTVSEGSPSRAQILHRADSFSSKGDDSHNNPLAPPPSLRSTPPLPALRPPQQNAMQQFFKHFPNPGAKRCRSCEEYENRLAAMATDMEYLRSAALQNEYLCRQCQCEESSMHSKESSVLRLTEASTRLAGMEKQHLEQIEHMTHQWSQWQLQMRSKLSKFATIAKDLNDQSRLRSLEGQKLEEELQVVKKERDLLASDVNRLSASLVHRDVERKEHELLKQIVAKYESEGLQRARELIAQRDYVIQDLSRRLEQALDTIELERRRHSHRRQIIFPQQTSLPVPPAHASIVTSFKIDPQSGLREELDRANEQIRFATIRLENAQAVAERSEAAYSARIAELEAKLSALGSLNP